MFPSYRKVRTKLVSKHHSAFGIRASWGCLISPAFISPAWCSSLTIYLAALLVFLSDITNPFRNEAGNKKTNVKAGGRGFFPQTNWKPGRRGRAWQPLVQRDLPRSAPAPGGGCGRCNQGQFLKSRSEEREKLLVGENFALCTSCFMALEKGGQERKLRSSFSVLRWIHFCP